jgi:membrane-associated phospholipid phosphatase
LVRHEKFAQHKTKIILTGKAQLFLLATVYTLKHTVNSVRPDGSDSYSFPSHHTAQAFMGATYLSLEYKDKYPWIPYIGYTLASTVAISRMANNSHYLSDVLVGAAIGILATRISFWTQKRDKPKFVTPI